jgi:hypothetical protein
MNIANDELTMKLILNSASLCRSSTQLRIENGFSRGTTCIGITVWIRYATRLQQKCSLNRRTARWGLGRGAVEQKNAARTWMGQTARQYCPSKDATSLLEVAPSADLCAVTPGHKIT